MSSCMNCDNAGWVCENHRDRTWSGVEGECCGGAGSPCPVCNDSSEIHGLRFEIKRLEAALAAANARCAWQAEMLEKIKTSLESAIRKQPTCNPGCTCLRDSVHYVLADLEKGPPNE